MKTPLLPIGLFLVAAAVAAETPPPAVEGVKGVRQEGAAKVKTIAAKMGWRGEEAELDLEPAGTIPEMGDEVRAELVAFFAPFDAALRAYLGEAVVMDVAKGWATSKAAGTTVAKKKRGKAAAAAEGA